MPRQSFVLLVLVMLTGLWTPPQGTKAQTECPEGGCKVYLPVVHTPRYVEASVTVVGPAGRGCPYSNVIVAVRNLSSRPITNVVVAGDVVSNNYDSAEQTNQYYLKTEDVLFPGESFNYPAQLGCTLEYIDNVRVSVFEPTYVNDVAALTVEQMEVTQIANCDGWEAFLVTGRVRNATSMTIVDAKAYGSRFVGRNFAQLEKTTLAPHETTPFRDYIGYGVDPVGQYPCEPKPPFPVDNWGVSLHSWGVIVP